MTFSLQRSLDWRRRFVEQQSLEEIRERGTEKRSNRGAEIERERVQELEKTKEKSTADALS